MLVLVSSNSTGEQTQIEVRFLFVRLQFFLANLLNFIH